MTRFAFAPLLLIVVVTGPALGQEKKIASFTTDLLPLKVGARWVYQAMEPKEKVVVTVERMEPVKRRVVVKGGAERQEPIESYILRIASGDKSLLEQILITEDGIYRYAAAGKDITPPLKIMKLPPKSGDTWTCQSMTEAVPLRGEFVVEQAVLNLPGKGPVPTWVSKSRDFTVGDQKMEATYWFVEGVGIAKQHVKIGRFEMMITLEEFRPGMGPANNLGLPPQLLDK
jgi:hypothetical protein